MSVSWARWTDSGVPWVAQQPKASLADVGSIATLSAACASGYDFSGPVAFQWRRNGVDVADGPGGCSPGGGVVSGAAGYLDVGDSSTSMSVSDSRPSDSGLYSVTFTNSCGTAFSQEISLVVPARCPADLNLDGAVNADDLGELLGAWGSTSSDTSADLDEDGFVDGTDLGILLGAWGPCSGA